MQEEKLKVIGQIHISHSVECPHCRYTFFDDSDRDWFNANITDQLPNEESYNDKYSITCKKCDQDFIVDGFQY